MDHRFISSTTTEDKVMSIVWLILSAVRYCDALADNTVSISLPAFEKLVPILMKRGVKWNIETCYYIIKVNFLVEENGTR